MILFNPFRVVLHYKISTPDFIRGYSHLSPSGYCTILACTYYKLFINSNRKTNPIPLVLRPDNNF